jgi:predicted secreted protein
MFDDARSKKIIIAAHCLLNQNSISDATADLPGQYDKIVSLLIDKKVGIIQLPCPELLCLGLARRDEDGGKRELLLENTRIRSLMEEKQNKDLLRTKVQEIVRQLEEYKKYNFEIIGIIGVNRSPSCGVEITTIEGCETEGQGVFMKILEEELESKGIKIKMTGVKTSEQNESLEKVINLFNRKE